MMPMTALLRFHFQASRPGLWFPTVWLYLLPLTHDGPADTARLGSFAFWLGLLFVTFPLNHLVYGWNDLVDAETDARNPRKGSYLFGARGTPEELATLPRGMMAIQALCWPLLTFIGGWGMVPIGLAIIAFLLAYNHPTRGLRGRPPGDLLSQVGYLLTVILSATLNGVPWPSPWVFAYLALFCAQSQLMGEVMDIHPDREAGRETTATQLGARGAKMLIIGVVTAEIALLLGPLHDPTFALGMAGFLAWLLLDLLVLFPANDQQYTLNQMRLFGIFGNICAVLSMGWVWWSGGFGHAA